MNEVADYLKYATYDEYAHSDSLPGWWNLDSVSSWNPSETLNIMEICRWTGPDGEALYAMCNRDPGFTKSVTMTFDGTYHIYHDDVDKGNQSSYSYTAGRGDVDVIRVE